MPNKHISELLRLMQSRYEIDRDTMGYADWICTNTTLRGKPFSFSKYPFQREIAEDMHQNLACIKISQIGLTEVQIRKMAAFLKRNQGTTGIFTFPDDDMRKRNSQQRISPIIDGCKVFNLNNEMEKPTRSIALYQIGQSFMNVVGNKEGDATSTSADIIFNDEVDLSEQSLLALFTSRVQGSDYKIIQKFSTPTYTGFGIDADFEVSDQKFYLIKCDCCNHWQFPMFDPRWIKIPGLPEDFGDLLEIDQSIVDQYSPDLINAEVVCEKCGAPLDLGRADNRNWVSKFPSRTNARGYRVNPFSVNTLGISYIVDRLLFFKRKDNMKGFKNTVLGLPEDGGTNRLSEAIINLAFTHRSVINELDKNVPSWIGIDVGQTCHIVIGQGYTLDHIETVKMMTVHVDNLIETVKLFCDSLFVAGGLIDRHPYEPTADAVRDVSCGLILPCEYRGEKEISIIKGPSGEELYTQAHRTTLLDEVKNAIVGSRLKFSGYENQKAIIITHLRNMVREEEPEKPAIWIKLSEDDHYFHATGFMLSAVKLKNLREIKNTNQQTYLGVAGCDMSGYNSDIFGMSKKPDTKWQNLL